VQLTSTNSSIGLIYALKKIFNFILYMELALELIKDAKRFKKINIIL
jgi:hypothetical protein